MFSERLKDLRKEKNVTQQDMATNLNIAKTTYASYEQGKRTPDTEMQNKIADYFSVTLDYLHGRNNTPRWANKQDTYDLKKFLDDNDGSFTYGGDNLTEDEKQKLRIAMTQIFWDRHKHD